jgi:predicted ATPase/DNA-binding SARP family transcriptional activator
VHDIQHPSLVPRTGRDVDVRVLGPFEVHGAGGRAVIGSPKQRRLLAALAVHVGEVVSNDRLIDILWGDAPPPSALNSLQTYVARVRHSLRAVGSEASPIVLRAPGYMLDIDPAQIDARRFEQAVLRARHQAPADPQGAAAALERALGWWRGPALAEFADQEFARVDAIRWNELRLVAVELRAQALLDLGLHSQAGAELEAHVAAHPQREEAQRLLMLALARAGRGPDALDVYRRFRALLRDELGLDPSAGMQQLERDKLAGAVALAVAPVVAPVPADGNFAVPTSSFVGRRRERSEIAAMLGRHRVVTITGPGGVGKTALALHVAASADAAYPDGTWLCELAPVRTASAIPHVIAAALGLVLRPGADTTHALTAALGTRRLLLVVDNCEHQLDACAGVVEAITRHCPGVTVLATGRERLGAAGEHVWPLSPLEVPDPTADVRRNPAVILFVERARAARPDFQITERNAGLVVQVCRRLDGLPLALELAAARLGALTLDDVASRLGDRLDLLSRGQQAVEARHRSLREVVDWSYDLLSDAERLLFQRLSVFAGGFTLDQAEAVCADRRVPARRIVTLLASLVDRSMVVRRSAHGRGRYALLETLRVYAQERLHEHGDHTAIQHAHARQFVAFAEAAAAGLARPDEAAWFAQTEAEVGNLRVAHEWAVDRGDSDAALRISAALHRFGFWRMRYEVLGWASAAAAGDAAVGHPLHGAVLASAGVAAWIRGDLTEARAAGEHALRLAEDHGMPYELLGDVAMFDGRSRDADELYGASARRYRAAGDVQSEVWALASQALSCSYAGLADEAAARVAETTTVASNSPNPTTQALALFAEGECLLDQDPGRAVALLDRSRNLAESAGNEFLAGVVVVSIASVLGRHGDPTRALHAFRDVIAHWRNTGNWMQQWTTLRNLAGLFTRLGEDELAAVLLGAATSAEDISSVYGPEAVRLADTQAALSTRLGPTTLGDLLASGHAMSGEDCVALASREIDRILG